MACWAISLVGAAPPRADENGDLELTIFDAITFALEYNLELRVEELSPAIASERIREAYGEFDPVFSVEGSRDSVERRQNTLEFLSTGQVVTERIFEEESILLRTGVEQKIPLGTVFDLHTRVRRVENSVTRDSPMSLFSPEYESFAGLQIRQPLLRGFGPEANLARIRVARLGLSMAEEEREIAVINKVSEVVNAYYDLIYAEENQLVKEEALAVSERILEENQRRMELGLMTSIDVIEARVRVSESREELIRARAFRRERDLELRRLIFDRADWNPAGRLRAVTELPEEIETPPDPVGLFAGALHRRPDYRLARNDLRRNRVRESFTRNAARPQLDLQFSFGYSGLDGEVGSSFDRVWDQSHPEWSAGVVLRVPWGNRQGRAQLAAVRTERRQAELELRKIEYDIETALQVSASRLEAIRQTVRTARESLQFAEEAVRIEERRLETGRTTTFRVLELQSAVSNARTRELAARVDGQKALASLWAVSGRLLDEYGFYLEDAAVPYEPPNPDIRVGRPEGVPVRLDWRD